MMFPRGGHWSRKGVWGCAALKTPFSRLSCHSQGSHFKQKSQFTRPPFEKIWKFKPLQPQFSPNFSSQAPKFGNFQLTSPQIWKFSAHKPPFSEANYVSSQAPHLGNPGRTPLPEKKLSAPPGDVPHWFVWDPMIVEVCLSSSMLGWFQRSSVNLTYWPTVKSPYWSVM